jgi:hypothetical protein
MGALNPEEVASELASAPANRGFYESAQAIGWSHRPFTRLQPNQVDVRNPSNVVELQSDCYVHRFGPKELQR